MRSLVAIFFVSLIALCLPTACVDPLDLTQPGKVDVVVVNGTITNLVEPQVIRLNRSKADPFTGRFGTTPITKATLEVVVDSLKVISAHETFDGRYELPADFQGQIGHSYQLRFTLTDGTQYQSNAEVMQAVPSISQVRAQFNGTSLGPTQRLKGVYAAAHDFYIDAQDPPEQHNYYRWDWILWETQTWCHSCENGLYLIWDPSDTYLYEDCFDISKYQKPGEHTIFDYVCRTQCWDVFYNADINVFDDVYSNGGQLKNRRVAQIPFYQHDPCLVEVRQLSLTQQAYRYDKLLQDQTQNTGGLADTPPSVLAGNTYNLSDRQVVVVGYFTASAVSAIRYWLDRKDTQGTPPGLFQLVHGRDPIPEPTPPPFGIYSTHYSRPPTALCVPGDSRTPIKPTGWHY